VTRIEERSREVWQWQTVESFCADLRYALRQLRKSPGFTLTAVITLALGIGANAAIFSLIDALFLKPLPLPHPERLLRIYAKGPSGHYGAGFSMPEFQNLREHTSSFSALAAEDHFPQLNLMTPDGSSAVSGARPPLIGIAIGAACSFVLARFLSSMLFGIGATDLVTLLSLSVLLASVALVACYIPARQAMRMDPVAALHCE
jgi:hypothetical protein